MPGTNAVYTFIGAGREAGTDSHIYDNCDAYPKGAAEKFEDAGLCDAHNLVQLRRVAINLAIGDVPGSLEKRIEIADWRRTSETNLRYEIRAKDGVVRVTAFEPDWSGPEAKTPPKTGFNAPRWRELFSGAVPEFLSWAAERGSIPVE